MKRALACLVLVGCVEHVQIPGDAGGELADLVSIDVVPPQTTIALTSVGSQPSVIELVATGHFRDGSTRTLPVIQWTVDNPFPGGFVEPGRYTTSGAAGHVTVRATPPSDGGESPDIVGTASITVTLSATIVDDVFPPPGDPETLFPPAAPIVTTDPMHRPMIAYPAEATLFPQSLAPITVQQVRGMANDAVRLALDGEGLHVVVYTGADRWRPDAATWRVLAESAAGGSLALSISATDSTAAAPAPIYGGAAPTTLAFARGSAGGVIDFWSNTTTGIMRASPSALVATKLYPDAADGTCAGCHAIARDGKTLAFGYGGNTLVTVDLATLAPLIPANAAIPAGWSALSPAGDRILVASGGTLTLYDPRTGAALGALALGAPATHPDWSPDGASVALVLAHMVDGNDMTMDGGTIARVPFTAASDTFGAPQMLVVSTDKNDNNYFPRWSPDGKWLAYVHANSASHGANSAELRLVSATGGAPIVLAAASHAVGGGMSMQDLADIMPAWAPPLPDADHAWLAFASARPYGIVRPMPMPSQIWIAGIDLGSTAADPSFAAFWLPSQTPTALDLNPTWSVAIDPIN